MNAMQPVRDYVYSLAEILSQLDLPDSPNLCFLFGNRSGVVQTSHLTNEELLSVPGMAESRWKYARTTHEWIPVFHFAPDNPCPIDNLLDLEPTNGAYDSEYDRENTWWATPKGFPREQYKER